MWNIFEHVLRYSIIDNNYKLLITFQRVDVYLKNQSRLMNNQISKSKVIEEAKITIILIFENKSWSFEV